jgi:hypothetical protein
MGIFYDGLQPFRVRFKWRKRLLRIRRRLRLVFLVLGVDMSPFLLLLRFRFVSTAYHRVTAGGFQGRSSAGFPPRAK